MYSRGIYLFSLNHKDKQFVKGLYAENRDGGNVLFFGALGACDLVVLDQTGDTCRKLCEYLKLDLGRKGSCSIHGRAVYFAECHLPFKFSEAKEWKTLCFSSHIPEESPTYIKISGFFTYLIPLEAPIWKALDHVLTLRKGRVNTFCIPISNFEMFIETPRPMEKQRIGLFAKVTPGCEDEVASCFRNIFSEEDGCVNNLKVNVVHGVFDLIFRYSLSVCTNSFLKKMWDKNISDGLLASLTYFPELEIDLNCLPGFVGVPHIQHEMAMFPFLLEGLVEGFDCSDILRLMSRQVKKRIECTDIFRNEPLEIRPHILAGGNIPTAVVNSSENFFEVSVLFYLTDLLKNRSESQGKGEIRDLESDRWNHDLDLGVFATIFEFVLSMKNGSDAFKDLTLPDFKKVMVAPRVNLSEAAATCLALLEFGEAIDLSSYEASSRNFYGKMTQFCRSFWGDRKQLKYEEVARFIIAGILFEAVFHRKGPNLDWGELYARAENATRESLKESFVFPPATGTVMQRCRLSFFLGSYEHLVVRNPSYKSLFEISKIFTDLWFYAVSALSDFLKIKSDLVEKNFSFGKLLAFSDGEICQFIEKFFKSHKEKMFEDLSLIERFLQLAELFVEHDFDHNLNVANMLFDLGVHFCGPEWLFQPGLKPSPFYKYTQDPNRLEIIGYECLTELVKEGMKPKSFVDYCREYVSSNAFSPSYLERPESYKTFELLRRIQLELTCIDTMTDGLKQLSVPHGGIISLNLVPWLLFSRLDDSEEVISPKKHIRVWKNGNPWYYSYRPIFLNKAKSFLRVAKEKSVVPYLELTEGEVIYPPDFFSLTRRPGLGPTEYKWKEFWECLSELKESMDSLGIAFDDQLGSGTDIQRLIVLIKEAKNTGFKKFLVKVDGSAIRSLLKVNGQEDIAFLGVISTLLACFEPDDDLIIVLEGFDGYDPKLQDRHRQKYKDAVSRVLAILETFYKPSGSESGGSNMVQPSGHLPRIVFQGR